jgi:hypothetical protein
MASWAMLGGLGGTGRLFLEIDHVNCYTVVYEQKAVSS